MAVVSSGERQVKSIQNKRWALLGNHRWWLTW
jgi:hypothetical protein